MSSAIGQAPGLGDDASLLVVLLDTSPSGWSNKECALSLHKCVEQVVAFINAFLLLHNHNRVALIAVHSDGCHFLYESTEEHRKHSLLAPPDRSAARVGEVISQKLKEVLLRDCVSDSAGRPPPLSGALSTALCYAQRHRAGLQPRILCLPAAPDPPAQYIAVMNVLFAAQRSGVVIDGCPVGAHDSAFLQQAAHLTKGVYLRPSRLDGLLQYLLSVFVVDTFSRKFIEIPRSSGVDFRASCFCHKRAIDLGYVCSVCLSIFCEPADTCSTCGTTYASQNPQPKRSTPAPTAPQAKRSKTAPTA